MKAYSLDLRKRVYETYLKRRGWVGEVAEMFEVSESFIWKLKGLMKERQSLELLRHGGGKPRVLESRHEEAIIRWLKEKPDLLLAEIADRVKCEFGFPVGKSTVWRALERLGITRKKSPPGR